jgi:hypothetical protein
MRTIMDMAREAGFSEWALQTPQDIERFAELVLAAERNHIAGVFEDNHEVVKHRNNYWLHAANYVRGREKEALAQPSERYFCPRCGKRLADLTAIHTCTPPQENA